MATTLDAPPDLANLGAYIARVRAAKGLSLPAVRRAGGPAMSTVNALENGVALDRPKRATLEKLALGLGVPLAEILDAAGEGTPRLSFDAAAGMKRANGGEGRYSVPLYGPVAAGEPLMWTADDSLRLVEAEPGDDAAFVIRGNSVSDYGIWDGDIVYARQVGDRAAVNGDMVVVECEGAYCCKIYRENKLGRYLESHEKGKDPEPFLLAGDVRLVAVVTRLSMKFRPRV